MIVERSMHPDWLSNTYLVAAGPGGEGFFVDAGGPVRPLLDKAEAEGITVTHVLLTHHHHDHVAELAAIVDRFPDAAVLIHPSERELVDGATGDLNEDETLDIGGVSVTDPAHARPHPGDALPARRRQRRLHRRHAVQELRRRRPRARATRPTPTSSAR